MSTTQPQMRVQVTAKDKKGEVLIYEVIGQDWWTGGGVLAKDLADELNKHGELDEIDVRINSLGGDVFEGLAIYNTLNKHSAKKNVYIDGIAASMGSVIAMVGETITMAENAMQMIHNPWSIAIGEADDFRKQADVLEQIKGNIVGIYAARTGANPTDVARWMDDETWLTAEEAIEKGFADEKTANKAKAVEAQASATRFKKIPAAALRLFETKPPNNSTPAPGAKPPMATATEPNTPAPPADASKALTQADVDRAAEQAIENENRRITEIQAICNMAKLPADQKTALQKKYTENRALSVENCRKELFDTMCKQNTPAGEGDGDAPAAPDENAEYRKEYRAMAAAYAKRGISEDEFVATRRIDDGKDKLAPKEAAK